MKGFILVFVVLVGLEYWYPGGKSKASTASPAISQHSPEMFKLESECGELREKFDRQYRREHASADFTVTSHYSPVSNRCFARVRDGSFGSDGDGLYDAQTMQVLAEATRLMSPTSPWFYTASIGRAGGTDYEAWNKAKDFIENAMHEEK